MGIGNALSLHPVFKLILVLSVLFVVSSSLYIAWITQHQLGLAHQALNTEKPGRALVHYARAISPYLPLYPARKQSIDEMRTLCFKLERAGKLALSLEGWRRLRGALLASRSIFGQPNRDVLERANREIARLAAATDTQGLMSRKSIEKEAARLLAENPKDISPFWGVMQFLLLLLWVGSTVKLIWDWAGSTVQRRMLAGGVSFGAFMGWLAALYLAS